MHLFGLKLSNPRARDFVAFHHNEEITHCRRGRTSDLGWFLFWKGACSRTRSVSPWIKYYRALTENVRLHRINKGFCSFFFFLSNTVSVNRDHSSLGFSVLVKLSNLGQFILSGVLTPQAVWALAFVVLLVRTVYTYELQIFWFNLSALMQIINKTLYFQNFFLWNLRVNLCVEKGQMLS